MSHALHTDPRSADTGLLDFRHVSSPEPMSWRAAGFLLLALSAAGWVGIFVAARHLIG